jgi:hypothetical protein
MWTCLVFTFAGNLDLFASRIATSIPTILLVRLNFTRAWDVRTPALLLLFHVDILPFTFRFRISRTMTNFSANLPACKFPNSAGQ